MSTRDGSGRFAPRGQAEANDVDVLPRRQETPAPPAVFDQKLMREGSVGAWWNVMQYWCEHSIADVGRPDYWRTATLLQPGDQVTARCRDGYVTLACIAVRNRHTRIARPMHEWAKSAAGLGVSPDAPITHVEVMVLSIVEFEEQAAAEAA